MKILMLPELACQTCNFASFVTCPASTYKVGNVVQTNLAASYPRTESCGDNYNSIKLI